MSAAHETDLGDFDPEHPSDDDVGPRYLMETHWHTVRHDVSDQWFELKVSAVHVNGSGPAVEIGPWSICPEEARVLATSLAMLADESEGSVVRR